MRLLFPLFLLLPIPAIASRSIALTTSNYLSSTTTPSGAPYNSITNIRFEFRIHNWTQATNYSHYFRSANFALRFVQNADQVLFTVWPDSSGAISISIAGRSDFIVRFQRDPANTRYTAEVWNADGTNYLSGTNSRSPMNATTLSSESLEIGDTYGGNISASLAYMRVYSTLVALGTRPSTTADGDLADWELEDNGNDASGNGINMSTVHGSLSYADTPIVNPHANAGSTQVITKGTTLSLDGSSSFTNNQGASLTYAWTQQSGPVTGSIVSASSATTDVTGLTDFGTYVFRLTVSDGVGTDQYADVTVGAVTVDSHNVTQDMSARMREMIGPVTKWGTTAWSWYDIAEMANGDVLGAGLVLPASGGTALSGTVTLSPCNGCPSEVNPVTVTGSGTTFTSDFTVGDYIWIWWDPPSEAAGSGRAWFTVVTITDDTHMILSNYYHRLPLGTYSGVQYSKPTAADLQGWGHGYPGTNNWNFYDNVLAFYRLYYRTGIDTYRTYARNLADAWWQYSLDYGYEDNFLWIFKSLLGMMVRAEDGGSASMWPGLATYLEAKTTFNALSAPVAQGYSIDARERGYEMEFDAMLAMMSPDSGVRSTMCGYVTKGVNYLFAPAQWDDGGWYNDTYAANAGYPYAGPGSFPWHMGVSANGLAMAVEAMGPSYCNDATTRATALATLKKALDYIYTIGRDSVARGEYYSTNFYANGQPGTYPDGATTETGTVSGSSGGTAITGSGTSFNTRYLCNGTDYIAIDSLRKVYLVASCADATHLTISGATLSADVTTSTFQRAPAMPSSCNSSASYCEGTGDRALINTLTAAFGHYYALTGDPTYKTRGDEFFSAAYGGTGDGPGGTAAPAGPDADGTIAQNYIDALPSCSVSAPPCGGYGLSTYNVYGKGFGQGSGTGGASSYLGFRETLFQPAAISGGVKLSGGATLH